MFFNSFGPRTRGHLGTRSSDALRNTHGSRRIRLRPANPHVPTEVEVKGRQSHFPSPPNRGRRCPQGGWGPSRRTVKTGRSTYPSVLVCHAVEATIPVGGLLQFSFASRTCDVISHCIQRLRSPSSCGHNSRWKWFDIRQNLVNRIGTFS